jgi:hypothetical protein
MVFIGFLVFLAYFDAEVSFHLCFVRGIFAFETNHFFTCVSTLKQTVLDHKLFFCVSFFEIYFLCIYFPSFLLPKV